MKNNFLLSIVIPSNNKTSLLVEAINSLFDELSDEQKKQVEICISDNSKNNDTNLAILNIIDFHQNLSYRRSLDAPSLDENTYMVSTMASGKYIWFFGDDDMVVPKSMKIFLQFLESTEHPIVIVNSQSFYLDNVIQTRRMPITQNIIFQKDNNNDFLSSMAGYLTYLPCIIIKKDLWDKNYNINTQGTYFSHIDCILRAKLSSSACFYADPIIKMRLHSQTWTEKHFQIWNIFYPKIIWDADGFSNEAKNQVINKNPLNKIKRYLSSRAYDRFGLKIWHQFVRGSQEISFSMKLIAILIALTPVWILRNLLIFQIKSFRSKQTMQFCPDLALALLEKLRSK